MAGSLLATLAPTGFAQSISSSSNSSSSSSSFSSVSSASSVSSLSSSRSSMSSLSSSRSSATSSLRRGAYRWSSRASMPSATVRSSARSVPATYEPNVPSSCRHLLGQAFTYCVLRNALGGTMSAASSQRSSPSRSSQSSSISSNTMSGSFLQMLFNIRNPQLSDMAVTRQLCMFLMNDPTSSCAQGVGLRTFNRQVHLWWSQLTDALRSFMIRTNAGGDDTGNYFWNSMLIPGLSSSSRSSSSVSSTSLPWWMGSSTSQSSMRRADSSVRNTSQREAWDACEGLTDRARIRCVRDFLNSDSPSSMSSGASSTSSL